MNTKSLSIDKMDFLVSFYIFCLVTAEMMGGKTFPLLDTPFIKLNASVAIFLMPLLFSINDVITEVYGPHRTRSVIRSGLIVIMCLFLFSLFATSLPPSLRFEKTENAYDMIFKQGARISFASLVAFAFADLMDVLIFVRIRNALGSQALWLRNNLSNIISQFLDTTLFMVLAFYDVGRSFAVNSGFLLSLIIPYWLLKCTMSVLETPLVYLGVSWLKRK